MTAQASHSHKESYQFLVLTNAEQPKAIEPFGLDPDNVIDYDFADAKENTTKYRDEFLNAGTPRRF